MSAMKYQEASSSASPSSYHVFLSFRGEDTRKTFTSHLYRALDLAGFHTFLDDDGIEKGEEIKSELERAIRESRISIIVLLENYASSTWCLEELVMILKRKTFGHAVLPIFYHVDPSEVRKQIGKFENAFKRHEEKLNSEMVELEKEKLKDKLGIWRAALRDVANLSGMNLKDQADGHEARFIQKIIDVVGDKISRTSMNIDPGLVGMRSRVENIHHWLEDEQSNVGTVVICGMGGIGKTTAATLLYNLNFSRFERASFIADVREISQRQGGLLLLQSQLLTEILKPRKVKLNNIGEGIAMIKDALCTKKVFLVLDDMDKRDQLDALLGIEGLLYPGSKIIITTRHERLLRAYKFCKVHQLEILSKEESLELFSSHAFEKGCPNDDYEELSKRAVRYCGGVPLAIKVIGSSLLGLGLDLWKSRLDKLEAIPDEEICEKLRISYESLDEHDKHLFRILACFFVGSNKDLMIENLDGILDGREFYAPIGIDNLLNRCLISVDHSKMLRMHHLLQEMGREIVYRESPREPGERSILWNHEDTLNVLRGDTGTPKIEALKLDMCLLKEEACRRSRREEFLGTSFLSNLGSLLQRYGFDIFSSHLKTSDSENSNLLSLETDAFAKMHKLNFVQLNNVHISGPYNNFPKGLRWLCWHRFPFESIPSDFPLEKLVALDMRYSRLKNVWKGTKLLRFLKILDLSYSCNLAKTPDVSEVPDLKRLIFKSCTSLVELHESIGSLKKLVLLDLEGCKNLRNVPPSIFMLKHLETLVISGCSSLDGLPRNMENTESLTVLGADGIALNQYVTINGQVNRVHSSFWPWRLKPRESPEISLPSLPWSLVELSLANCNLSEDNFPRGFSNLCSLKKLNLQGNLFRSLPYCIRGLTKLEFFDVSHCSRLRELGGVPEHCWVYTFCDDLLEEWTHQISYRPITTCLLYECKNRETPVQFKIVSIENVKPKVLKNLGVLFLLSTESLNVQLGHFGFMIPRSSPIQVCYEEHLIYAIINGNEVPPWFNFKNLGSSIDFDVPSYPNSRIRGLNACLVYEHSRDVSCGLPHTLLSNRTKGLVWSCTPWVNGTAEYGKEIMWLIYWKLGNYFESGDEVNFFVDGGEELRVKEVGVRLLYKEKEGEMGSQSAYEDKIPHHLCEFGNINRDKIPHHLCEFGNINRDKIPHHLCEFGNINRGIVSADHHNCCWFCQDLLNRRVEAFIIKFNAEMRLQRQESDQRFLEKISR